MGICWILRLSGFGNFLDFGLPRVCRFLGFWGSQASRISWTLGIPGFVDLLDFGVRRIWGFPGLEDFWPWGIPGFSGFWEFLDSGDS